MGGYTHQDIRKYAQEVSILSARNAAKDKEIERLRAECDRAKSTPMKYRRMEFNAQLQEEVTKLRAELDALKSQEPVAWIDGGDARALMQGNSVMVHPADQGLMAPLYAAPVPSIPPGTLDPLYKLLDYADESDGACYSTLSTRLVRDLVNEALAATKEKS